MSAAPVPAVRIGDIDVHVLVDGIYEAPISDLIHTKDTVLRDQAIAAWNGDNFAVDVNCFALSGPAGLILVDSGAGEHWGPAYGHAATRLAEAGFAPAQVNTVLLTHIHGDHALGLVDGLAARFLNANVYLPRADLAWYGDNANLERTPENVRGGFRNLKLVSDVYGNRLKPVEPGPVLPRISAIALPGHTPGHSGYMLQHGGESLLFCGDVIHLDALQLADPQFGFNYDFDPELARDSRQKVLEKAADEACYVAGGHITGIRRIVRSGKGFAFAEENP